MSLKTTPKGLLAALAALCIILLQAPALRGGVADAAHVGSPHVAAPTHHAAAIHRSAIRPHTQTIGPSSSVPFTQTLRITGTNTTVVDTVSNSSAAISPTAGPAGTPITITGNTGSLTSTVGQAGVLVTANITDSAGIPLATRSTTSGSTGAFTLTSTIPVTAALGAAIATVSYTNTDAISGTSVVTNGTSLSQAMSTLHFTVNQPSIQYTPNLGANLRAISATLVLTNFAPGVAITPTVVYSSTSGVTKTAALSLTTPLTPASGTTASVVSPTVPISDSSVNEGNISGTIYLPTDLAFGTTGVISVAATYPVTPVNPITPTSSVTLPTFTVGTPTVSVAPIGPSALAITSTGPLGPNFLAGQGNTLNVHGTGFIPNQPVTPTVAISGSTTTLLTGAPATADSSGAFTTTLTFTPTVAGTYDLTATDITAFNAVSTTFQVVSGPVLGPPVATQYFVEGYTGLGANNGKAGFQTTFDILNPNVSTVVVTNTYMLETIDENITTTTAAPDVVVVTHTLPALADIRVDAATDIASAPVISGPDIGKVLPGTNQKFATEIQTAGFQATGAASGLGGIVRGVAVQRSIERTLNTGQRADGDTSLGTTAPNTSYYFAEGYTGASFQEYLLLLNPSPTVTATVSVIRVPEGGATTETPLVSGLVLAPRQRVTLNIRRLNALSAERSIGLIVNSADNPIVAERTEYFGPGNGSAKYGESIAAGLTTAAKQLNFAYGSLTAPITSDVLSTITPTSDLAQTADDRPFIEVINPNIAGQLIAGTYSGSATAPGPAAHVTIQLRGEDGRLLGFFFTDVDAGARFTLTYNDLTSSSSGIGFPGVPTDSPTRAGVFSAVVSSSERVVAEESQYYGQGGHTPSGDANSGAPGLDLVGAPSGETDVLFPAMSTVDPASAFPLQRTVFLYNPGVDPTRINATFFGTSGVVGHQVYTVQPDAIVAIGQSTAYSSGSPVTATATISGGVPLSIPAGTTGAEFSTIQQRGPETSGEPARAPETFVAAQITHSVDGSQWWGTQGLYPLPTSCATPTGQPLPSGCP